LFGGKSFHGFTASSDVDELAIAPARYETANSVSLRRSIDLNPRTIQSLDIPALTNY
jgi:hypothetical protein